MALEKLTKEIQKLKRDVVRSGMKLKEFTDRIADGEKSIIPLCGIAANGIQKDINFIQNCLNDLNAEISKTL